MKQEIIERIDSMIGYLQMTKEWIAEGSTEQSDTPDVFSLVSMMLDNTNKDVKKFLQLKDAA